MFGQNNSGNGTGRRGPIALSDDDLVGATGIEWEDIEAQLRDDDEEDQDREEEMDDMASRPLKPMTGQDRYVDDDDEGGEELSSNVNGRYRDDRYGDDNGDEDGEAAGSEQRKKAGSTVGQKDLFKLEDADSD
ncbi:hypothetical protein BGX27_000055 [Mortierella sp. AM989]|nr:hypothetical protein BGX27_000055 [Mortierella sp. AM989]